MQLATRFLGLGCLLLVATLLFGAEGDQEGVQTSQVKDRPIKALHEFEFAEKKGDPGPMLLRRLTVKEYVNTVRDTLDVDISSEAKTLLPPDLRADGFTNTAYNLNIDLGHVDAQAQLAKIIVARIDPAKHAARYSKSQEVSEKNLTGIIDGLGLRFLRSPLSDSERSHFLKIANLVKDEGGSFSESIGFVIEAMLQSPRFMYRLENQEGDGEIRRVNDYELASRLSYILWGGPPDEALYLAAEKKELSTREGVEREVKRMLADPKAIERSCHFVEDWLHLSRMENLNPSPEHFPTWNSQLARDMREETLAYYKEILWEQKRPMSDLLNAQVTFVTPRLAKHYGLESEKSHDGPTQLAELRKNANEQAGAEGLLALYAFNKKQGDTVHDLSGNSPALDLIIDKPDAVEWTDAGLKINQSTTIATNDAPKRLNDALKKSQEITVEAWITPNDDKQDGPARIVSLSSNTTNRNFTLGQDGNKYDFRLRAKRTTTNGLPSTSSNSNSVKAGKLQHVVYTRDVKGETHLYVDNKEVGSGVAAGDFSNWTSDYRLAIGNELTGDRAWRGVLHWVAIYDRVLPPANIAEEFAGPKRVDLTDVASRGGLLTHGSVLTMGGDEASMVTRGLFVLHDLLGGVVDDPPPCVDTTPIPAKPGLSQRAISEKRIDDLSCGGCHETFEPLAFGLERFDGIGAYREMDQFENKLREDGEIIFPGESKAIPFTTSAEMMNLLADSERVRQCITLKVTQWAIGRPLVASDSYSLHQIHTAANAGGGDYQSLMTAIVMSHLVQTTRTEPRR